MHDEHKNNVASMNAPEYLEQRISDQIAWYGQKAAAAKWGYMSFRAVEILAAALIPLVLHFMDWSDARIIAATLGALVVVINGLLGVFGWHDIWKTYRTTAESIKHHKFLFSTGCAPYDGDGAFFLLVNNVENLISKENSDWREIATEKRNKSS